MHEPADDDRPTSADEHLECERCGACVPRAIYREHLLKTCPGE